jgi:hypothetical protein
MNLLESNLHALRGRYPDLAKRLESFPDKPFVRIFRAADGNFAYGVQRNGHIVPVTDPLVPGERLQSQLDRCSAQIHDFTRPILIVGLYPGDELVGLFDLSERVNTPHCPQPILVCVDSLICLYGFLQCWDARLIIDSLRVKFLWHEDIPQEIIHLRNHPEFPHVFTLVTGASDQTLNAIIPPFATLVAERDSETQALIAKNEAYYDSVSDEQLSQRIAQGTEGKERHRVTGNSSSVDIADSRFDIRRGYRPRLLMPTCSWSTFIQYSTRDTCAAFENLGWETRTLKMDAMITPYHLVRSINDFKPDVFLFIDHLRYEAEGVYPRNMMFVTWIQDEMDHIQCAEAGRKLTEYAARGKRDLIIGYTQGLDTKYGYPRCRLMPLNIPADRRIFHPLPLTDTNRMRYGCELAFMSNVSMSSEQVIEQKILPTAEPLGVSRNTLEAIHDHLWKQYRDDRTFASRELLLRELMAFEEFSHAWNALGTRTGGAPISEDQTPQSPADSLMTSRQDELLRLFYWRLNDTIYRHVVLEWADELGIDLHLYGQGWEDHPRFRKYARGPLPHGPELNIAYQAARRCLHLNITQGMHQRIHEIVASSGRLLVRTLPARGAAGEPPRPLMRRLVALLRLCESTLGDSTSSIDLFSDEICWTQEERQSLVDWIFGIVLSLSRQDATGQAGRPLSPMENRVLETICSIVNSRLDWNLDDWEEHCFSDRRGFADAIRRPVRA